MDPVPQLARMRSQAQRVQLESWLGMQLPFDDEVLDYLLRLSKVVESEELSLLVADFCPHWPEGMQLALAASLSPQALRVPWHGAPGAKQILLQPAPQDRRGVPQNVKTIFPNVPGEIDMRPKLKPMLPEATRREVFREAETEVAQAEAELPKDLAQTIKDIVQEQLALQQRLQRSASPKAGGTTGPPRPSTSRCASPDAEAEKRQKATSFRPREHSIQEIINQQLLLQEQLRPLADGGREGDASMSLKLDLPSSEATEFKADPEALDLRPVKDLSSTQETHRPGGPWLGAESPAQPRRLSKDDSDFQREEPGPVQRRLRQRNRSTRHESGRHHVSIGNRMIDVAVKLPDGRTSWQRLPPEVTSLQLKQRLAQESGLDVDILKVTFLGLRLKDHWRLVDCGIRAHDKLQASYVAHHPFGKDLGRTTVPRAAAGPLPRLEDPSSDVVDAATDASPLPSPLSPSSGKVEDEEPRWTAAVASLQHGIDALQETMKSSQQAQQENLADCRHSLTMLQQQQQHQLKSLHFIEDQQRSLFAATDSSDMKQNLKEVQLEQEELRSRLDHLRDDLLKQLSGKESIKPVSIQQASPSLPSASPLAETEHRSWLILQVFRMLDRDRDGLLQQRELMGLARLMGFNFSQEDWQQEYQALCRDMGIQPHRGFDRESFTKLLDSEDGCPATDENLFEALINHCPDKARAAAAVELFERLDLDRDGFLSRAELSHHFGQEVSQEGADHYGRYDLPAFQLLLAPVSPQLASPQVTIEVTSPLNSALASAPSTVKSAASPGEASGPSSPSHGTGPRRNDAARRLFEALDVDGDGRCSGKDLAVVFASRYEAWPMHFRKLCTHWKVKQKEGVDVQTFVEMLEEPGDLGLGNVSEEDLERMISDQQPKRSMERRASRQDRSRLIDALFFYLDSNQDGLLDLSELQPLAAALEVQDWQKFQVPLDLDAFRVLVNDGSKCLYCDDGALPSLLARFSRKG